MTGSGTPQDPYKIYDRSDLGSVRNNLSAHYVLANSINASDVYSWSPIGGYFSGSFDGRGHTIHNIRIRSNNGGGVGIFSRNQGEIRNVGIANCEIDIEDKHGVGGGGLVGWNEGIIENCCVEADIMTMLVGDFGSSRVGGLVGSSNGTIKNCYARGYVDVNTVNGTAAAGGLVGDSVGGTIENCYAAVRVEATSTKSRTHVGGLVGSGGSVKRCYATGNVFAISYDSPYIGGLVGGTNGFYNLGNNYRYSGQVVSPSPENTEGTATSLANLQSVSWAGNSNNLGWDLSKWDFVNKINGYPRLYWETVLLKAMFNGSMYNKLVYNGESYRNIVYNGIQLV